MCNLAPRGVSAKRRVVRVKGAELTVEVGDLATERLLDDEQARRRAGEVQHFGHGDELPQRPHVELRIGRRAIHASGMLVTDEHATISCT